MSKTKRKRISPAAKKAMVLLEVRDLLGRSPAFWQLPSREKNQIAADTIKVAGYLTELPDGTDGLGRLVNEDDFPAFAGDLINRVFRAIVDASIQQMEAYGELVAAVSKSVDRFRDENISDNQARDFLTEKFPNLFTAKPPKPKPKLRVKRPPATSRQQLLATMVLMGINRIVKGSKKRGKIGSAA